MMITGDAIARVEDEIRITGISLDGVESGGLELYSPEYSKNTIKTGIRLDNLNSIVKYKILVTNTSGIDMTINSIVAQVNNNPNIIFEYDYELESKIGPGVTIINLTFKYNSSVTSLPTDTVSEVVLFFELDEYVIPMLAPKKTWYKSKYTRNKIQSIEFVDEYTPGSNVIDSWDASVAEKGAVMAYVLDDFSLIIAGRGDGVIYANPDSSFAFSSYLDEGQTTNEYGFTSVTSLTGTEIFDTSTATNMSYMFYQFMYYKSTFDLDVSFLDTSNVTDMSNMFYQTGGGALTWNISGLGSLNTFKVTNMSNMFFKVGYSSDSVNFGDLSSWNTSNVTNMDCVFTLAGYNATTFSLGDLANWKTSSVTIMNEMFAMTEYNATTWNVGNLSKWDVSNVTNMMGMFAHAGYKATTFNIGDISGWDVSKVSIFSAAVTVNGNSLSGIDGMFAWAGENATTFYIGDIGKWNTSSATIMDCMFFRAGLNATYTLNLSSWDVSKVTSHLYFNEWVSSKVTAPTWVS